jgi:hypothetical protein
MDIRSYNFEDEVKDMMTELNDKLMQELYPVGLKPQGQPTNPEMQEDPLGPKEQANGGASSAKPGMSDKVAPIADKAKQDIKANGLSPNAQARSAKAGVKA